MPVVQPSLVEEKKSKEESTAVKKRKRELEEGKLKTKLNSQEHLEMGTAGAVSSKENLETVRRLAKKHKAGKGKLRGKNEFGGDFGSISEKKIYDLNVAVDAELGPKNGKKKREKRKKDAIGLEELGDGGFIMGDENGGPVCESENKTKLGKKKRKKEKKKADENTMALDEPDNVDMGEGDDRVVCESEKYSVTLEEGKQVDMSKREEKIKKGKKKRKESANVPQDIGQNAPAAGDVKSGNKERKRSKDKNEAGKMRKEKVAQQKDKGKRVSFTDAVEVFSDGVDDKESNERDVDEDVDEGSESKLVHGKRFTKEEDAKIMEALRNYAEMKQLGEKGLETFRDKKVRVHWKEIAKALPHRPLNAVYNRARILIYRSATRKWTKEEYEILRRFVEKHGRDWVTLAAELGKSNIHVKDCWRRIKQKNLRKGHWTQDEYQNLFDLVNFDLRVRAHQKNNHGHRQIRENISWEAISDKLTTRSNKDCCRKWYENLASPLVKQGVWEDTDDYLLVEALQKVDAVCLEDVDWDNLLDHRSGELCRQRWNQMVRALVGHREKSFIEQVEVLSRRYTFEMIDYRKQKDV